MKDSVAKMKMILALSLTCFPIIVSAIVCVSGDNADLKKRLVNLFFEFFQELDTAGDLGLTEAFTRKQFLKMAMSITETEDKIIYNKKGEEEGYDVLEESEINPLQNSTN